MEAATGRPVRHRSETSRIPYRARDSRLAFEQCVDDAFGKAVNALLTSKAAEKVLFATESIPQRLKPNLLQCIYARTLQEDEFFSSLFISRNSLTYISRGWVRCAAHPLGVLTHLTEVSACGTEVAILHGAEDVAAVDGLAGLQNISYAASLGGGSNARSVHEHVVRSTAVIDGREVGVGRSRELRGVGIKVAG